MARPPLLSIHTPTGSPSRLASAAAGLCSAVLAAVAFAAAYSVVFVMRIGPTAVTVDAGRGWGAHTGDVLAVPLAGLGALCLAFMVFCVSSLRRPPTLVVRPRPRR